MPLTLEEMKDRVRLEFQILEYLRDLQSKHPPNSSCYRALTFKIWKQQEDYTDWRNVLNQELKSSESEGPQLIPTGEGDFYKSLE